MDRVRLARRRPHRTLNSNTRPPPTSSETPGRPQRHTRPILNGTSIRSPAVRNLQTHGPTSSWHLERAVSVWVLPIRFERRPWAGHRGLEGRVIGVRATPRTTRSPPPATGSSTASWAPEPAAPSGPFANPAAGSTGTEAPGSRSSACRPGPRHTRGTPTPTPTAGRSSALTAPTPLRATDPPRRPRSTRQTHRGVARRASPRPRPHGHGCRARRGAGWPRAVLEAEPAGRSTTAAAKGTHEPSVT